MSDLALDTGQATPEMDRLIAATALTYELILVINIVRECANLQWLNLRATRVRDVQPLAILANLRYLDLSDTAVQDVQHLACLGNLQDLYLRGTGVPMERIDGLRMRLPGCRIEH